jgi:hypothetical protein
MSETWSIGMYRALVGHMTQWKMGIDQAMVDCGCALPKLDVIYALSAAGWNYDEETSALTFDDGDHDDD